MLDWLVKFVRSVAAPKTAFTMTLGATLAIPIVVLVHIAKDADALFAIYLPFSPELAKDPLVAQKFHEIFSNIALVCRDVMDVELTSIVLVFCFAFSAVVVELFLYFQERIRAVCFYGLSIVYSASVLEIRDRSKVTHKRILLIKQLAEDHPAAASFIESFSDLFATVASFLVIPVLLRFCVEFFSGGLKIFLQK